jgi:hypothetical protein
VEHFRRELVRYCLQNQFLITPNDEALLVSQQGFMKSDQAQKKECVRILMIFPSTSQGWCRADRTDEEDSPILVVDFC